MTPQKIVIYPSFDGTKVTCIITDPDGTTIIGTALADLDPVVTAVRADGLSIWPKFRSGCN